MHEAGLLWVMGYPLTYPTVTCPSSWNRPKL